MQFLEFSPRERRRLNFDEILLMLARMALLAIVAFALARPFWSPRGRWSVVDGRSTHRPATRASVATWCSCSTGRRRMARQGGGTTARDRAIAWARAFVNRLKPGDSVALLVAGDRVRGVIDPPSFDLDSGRPGSRRRSVLARVKRPPLGDRRGVPHPRKDVLAGARVRVRLEGRGGNSGVLGEDRAHCVLDHRPGAHPAGRRGEHLDPVARREEHDLAEMRMRRKLLQDGRQELRRRGEPLAHLDRGGLVREPDDPDLHRARLATAVAVPGCVAGRVP